MWNLDRMSKLAGRWTLIVLWVAALCVGVAQGETCTTQSAMTSAERDGLAAAARRMAEKVLANDASGLRAVTIEEYAKDFTAIQSAVGNVSV